ncbi:MAG TPA: glycosyltransferase family 2 protein, partial [Ktedonobacterales bacterium]
PRVNLRALTYRLTLLGMTVLLMVVLLRLQVLIGGVAPEPKTDWQYHVRWLEVLWLAPLPLAVTLWIGWFLFAETSQRPPDARPVPLMPPALGCDMPTPARLVFRFCTRGQNSEVLRESVRSIHAAFASYTEATGPYTIEVVTEEWLDLDGLADVYTVPLGYETEHHSRYKARALTYLQQATRPSPADWHVYLDEESTVDAPLIAGIYDFIARARERALRHGWRSPHLIGQGGILYEGGSPFFRGADAIRTGDDLGRFRLQYALGAPIFGVHGSYLVTRGSEERALSFDVGAANSITEDAAWALRAWARGWRFGWVRGYLHEQPPQRTMDFVRQRARWLSGIRKVVRDRAAPRRYRLALALFTLLWQISVLPLGIALIAVATRTQPFTWARIPADFAWVTYLLAYLHGLDAQARFGRGHAARTGAARLARQALEWCLALGLFWYALLEVAGVLYSVRRTQGFFVIQKPRLTKTAVTRPPAHDVAREGTAQ